MTGPTPLVKDALTRITHGKTLDETQAHNLMLTIMDGHADTAQIAGIITGLAARGETIEEITGFARAMREKSNRIQPHIKGRLVDTCGTGGAPTKTFNISTASAFVAAGAGANVAKHGNRSSTSPSGSADVLEALGAELDQTPNQVTRSIETVGIGFLFSPNFHPAMKHAMPARRALGVRTVFNLLGPLTNPAGADAQVLGVPRDDLVEPLAHVLNKLGTKQALVLHGAGGLDEASTLGKSHVAHVVDGSVTKGTLDPKQLDLPLTTPEKIATMDPKACAQKILSIFNGDEDDPPRRDIILLNAACAIHVAGLADTLEQGLEAARESIQSGNAQKRLERYIESTGGTLIETPRPRP